MISDEDYLYFANRAIDGMVNIVTGLGDELANQRPPIPGANSPYALLTHCLGVVSYWAGALVAGREVIRDHVLGPQPTLNPQCLQHFRRYPGR